MCDIVLDNGALALIRMFEAAGYEAYAVGGCIRDALMRRPVSDTDVAVSVPPDVTERVLKENGVRFFETGVKHGTVTALLDGVTYELTTFRVDGGYKDHRRPDSVTFVSGLDDDLARRDFTVNAIAFSPRTGVVDPFGGSGDIGSHILRAVGDPEKRFSEDALRILRGMRFCSTLDFEIEPDTAAAMRVCAPLLSTVARERVTAELLKLLKGAAAARALRECRDVLPFIHPALASADERAFSVISALPQNALLRLAALLIFAPDDGLYDLRLSGKERRTVKALLACANEPMPRDRAEIKRRLRTRELSLFKDCCLLRSVLSGEDPSFSVKTAESVIENGEPYRMADLAVNGGDLVLLGISGKNTGAALSELLELVTDEKLPNEREAIMKYVTDKYEK